MGKGEELLALWIKLANLAGSFVGHIQVAIRIRADGEYAG